MCNTFGIFTPSYPIVFLVVNHCYTAHPSIYQCQIYNLSWIICHPAPSILAQPCGQSNPLLLVVPLAQEIPRKKWRFNWANVSSKPTYAGWATNFPRWAHAGLPTHNSRLAVWHAIVEETNSSKMNHMTHMSWNVARNLCNVMGTQRRHTLEVFYPTYPRMSGLHAWNSSGKDVPCCWVKRVGVPKVMCSPFKAHWHVTNNRSRKYWKPFLVQPTCATIPGVHAIAQSYVVDVKGGNDNNNGGDSLLSIQLFGL